jgi:hypothetical protein
VNTSIKQMQSCGHLNWHIKKKKTCVKLTKLYIFYNLYKFWSLLDHFIESSLPVMKDENSHTVFTNFITYKLHRFTKYFCHFDIHINLMLKSFVNIRTPVISWNLCLNYFFTRGGGGGGTSDKQTLYPIPQGVCLIQFSLYFSEKLNYFSVVYLSAQSLSLS